MLKHWQKLVANPARRTILKALKEPLKKTEISEKTGIKQKRCSNILRELQKAELVDTEIQNGRRKFHRELNGKQDEIQQQLLSNTVGGTKKAVENREYRKARQHLTYRPPAKGKNREKVTALEAAEKLDEIT
ncbi:MAG: ArsR/SmtB family transcription factor [Candidatus Nanohalobium sp.]